MPEEVSQHKIIGLAETMFIMLLVGIEELIELLILLITLGAGIIIVEVMNGAVFMMIGMYIFLRGGKGVMKLIIQPIGAFINGATLGLAPGKTIALGTGIWIINHPEKMEKMVGKIGAITGQIAQVAMTAAGGAVGSIAAKVGGKVIATGAETAARTVVEGGASSVRQRMTMATRGASAKVVGAERMLRERARAQQASQQIEEAPDAYQKAA